MRRTLHGCVLFALAAIGFGSRPTTTTLNDKRPFDTLNRVISPPGIRLTYFSGPDLTPSPACLAAAATGEVFVGVDMIGSLGKNAGKGRIVKLTDTDNDGKADKHTVFASVNNPRGILPIGDKVYVLHTTFSAETGIATGMDLVVFTDKDNDGVADGPSSVLINNICSPKFIQTRGTDHATNGIRMGIDGWIYVAVGDFGFHNAVDRSGRMLTMQGGGVVRVRPDGTGMEIYTHGFRNIYDVAIDPYMNVFTRDNTNDGGGWNIRFSHHIQSGEYGYPFLFKHFTEEILPALVDVGGGSGTGALFMDEPGWPETYNRVPMMADWGKNFLYLHRVTADGSSFTQKDEEFIRVPQITDLDVDGSGRLYLSAWDGAGYSGSASRGFVMRATPKNLEHKAFPDLKSASVQQLSALLQSASAVARLNAQQELLTRNPGEAAAASLALATDAKLPLANRIAGLFTYAQVSGAAGNEAISGLVADKELREFALRALADRKEYSKNVSLTPFLSALNDPSPRVRSAAIVALGRLGRPEAIPALLKIKVPASFKAPVGDAEGPHAAPNSEIINAHLAVRALVSLNAVNACLAAIGTERSTLALWALRYMHDPVAVKGLMNAWTKTTSPALKRELVISLCRLYKTEGPYEGLTWWSTRPDGHGPYYDPVTWASSPAIRTFLLKVQKTATASQKAQFVQLNDKFQLDIAEFGKATSEPVAREAKVDLEAIKNKKGQVGASSIEDVMIALAKLKGNAATGRAVFLKQGCTACHSVAKGEPLKGPFMGQIGSIMTREQIAESILKPNASISQGFATVLLTLKGNRSLVGFVTAESPSQITMRDIAGKVTRVKTSEVTARKEMPNSMMPPGLANSLSFSEFAGLVTYLSMQKK